MVFGLDIGTRSIVGTVGYRDGERFIVKAECAKEHETRAMLDGQIHDIRKVGGTIKEVKETLEKELGFPLKDVCIAAAGRVLRTVTIHEVFLRRIFRYPLLHERLPDFKSGRAQSRKHRRGYDCDLPARGRCGWPV